MSEKELPVRDISEALDDVNIIDSKKFHRNVDFVFSKITNSISKTLGPGGGYTMISNINTQSPVLFTKDGYTVIQEFKFNDQIKFFIAETIKDISKRMNINVGDSTTSGILISYDLYTKLKNYDITKKYPEIGSILPPISIRNILESVRIILTKKINSDPNYTLKQLSRDIEDKYIEKVATIAANNDSEIGKEVAELFTSRKTDHVFVTTEVGTSDETVINKEVGFQFGSGFINPVMANQTDRITCKLSNPKFLLVDGPLTLNDLNTLNKIIDYVIFDLKQPMILVAKDYDQPVLNMLLDRCTKPYTMKGNVPVPHEREPIAALSIDTSYEKSRDRLEDLRILLGGEIIETKKGKIINFKNNVDFLNKFLGEAEEFSGTQLSSRVKRGKGDKSAVMERIQHIEQRIKEHDLNEGILAFSGVDALKRRIAMMNSDMTIIKVGGLTDKERRAKQLIYDDAILACTSAISSGIAIGGNLNIPHYIHKYETELVNEITDNLLKNSKHIIIGNNRNYILAIIKDIVTFVADSFKIAYTVAIENMVGFDTDKYNEILKMVYTDSFKESDKPKIFNLVNSKLTDINDIENTIPVPANTDFELMSSIFGTVGTLISSNQFLSVYPGDTMVYKPKVKE